MSFERAKDILKTTSIALDALNVIKGLTKLGGKTADEILLIIGAIVDSLQDGLSGATSPEIVEAELKALIIRIADNDAAADKALADKFK